MPARVIGCGNTDRGDDAAGLLVARRLREKGIEAREHSGEGLSLLESWAGAESVILVDAVVTGKAAGEITVWDALADPVPRNSMLPSTHHFGIAEAVELARALGRLPSRLLIYGIEGRRFELGSAPSPEVLRAVENLAKQIAADALPPTGTSRGRRSSTPLPPSPRARRRAGRRGLP